MGSKYRRPGIRLLSIGVLAACLALSSLVSAQETRAATAPTRDCKAVDRSRPPLPSSLDQKALQGYDRTLFTWLDSGAYLCLGWAKDKSVRDTGPYIAGKAYGTHPTVRIVYSPEVIAWMRKGRKGPIPDGAMIVKEQLKAPAARYDGMSEAEIERAFAAGGKDWTVMIRDSRGAKDGWYWAEVFSGMKFDADASYVAPFAYPNGGFGHYCLNCHASAANEYTFAALNNVTGFPGDPISFRVDNSWRAQDSTAVPVAALTTPHQQKKQVSAPSMRRKAAAPADGANAEFLATFPAIAPVAPGAVRAMVPETFDRVVSPHTGPKEFLSSDQCLGCHGAVSGYAPVMFIPVGSGGINLSPYGEWRWSPMGLAGRDPVFYAQLESELAYIERIPDAKTREALRNTAVNTCFRCHGVMGKRQWDIDHKCDPTSPVNPCDPARPGRPQFEPGFVDIKDSSNPHFKYGALARDGISCASCHRAQATRQPPGSKENSLKYFLEHSITGLFQTGARDRIIGPFKDDEISPDPMQNALGIKPRHDDYIKSPRLCGSCHAINLPVIDRPPIEPVGPRTHYNMEQATYLEWLNSRFQTEIPPVAACKPSFGNAACGRTCQDCHMPRDYRNAFGGNEIVVDPIRTKFAVIEDQDLPQTDHRMGLEKIRVRFRESGFVRHELVGANAFVMEMFRQKNEVLGVRLGDFMSGVDTGLPSAIANVVRQVQRRTARIEVNVLSATADKVVADVTVSNLTGHRFPSGVGFRRAFIEFVVMHRERVVWSSGRTNGVGVIVGNDGKPLPSEFFEEYVDTEGRKRQHFQQHHETIASDRQVQIYEELTQDAEGKFTTSFLRRDHDGVKDNRLLPVGWTRTGPDPKNFGGEFLAATFPKGLAAQDLKYRDGSGTDVVRYEASLPPGLDVKNLTVQATLYYQSIPPYYLAMRFREAPDGPATKRLYYLASNLKVEGTAIADWKLRVVGTGPVAIENRGEPPISGR